MNSEYTTKQAGDLYKAISDSLGAWLFVNHPKIFERSVKVLMYDNAGFTDMGFRLGMHDTALKGLLVLTHPIILELYDLWLEVKHK